MLNSVYYRCVLLPLGSPTGTPERSYVHVPQCPDRVVHDAATVQDGVWCRVGIPGWVYRVGTRVGYYRDTQPAARGEVQHQRSGPVGPAGAGVVGAGARTYRAAGTAPGPPLRGPVDALWASPCPGPSECRPGPIRRDSMKFLRKLVKTAECHQKCQKRPVIVPILQNGYQKSPLDFLGFPFGAAFSHKELMGHFEAYTDVHCQNDEVSTVCTGRYSASGRERGVSDTPTVTAASRYWSPLLI